MKLVKHECKPCGKSGFPTLVYKEWELDGEPGVFVCLSYYTGLDVQPLSSLYISDRTHRADTPASWGQELASSENDIFDDVDVRLYVDKFLKTL